MLSNMTKLKCFVDGKEHIYYCDQDCNSFQVKEALFQFIKYIGQLEDNARIEAEKKQNVVPLDQSEQIQEEAE